MIQSQSADAHTHKLATSRVFSATFYQLQQTRDMVREFGKARPRYSGGECNVTDFFVLNE